MINREKLIEEIAGVINRNSLEKAFNDTPDFVLARVAVEAMEMFTRASAHRDDYHEFRTADYKKKYDAIRGGETKTEKDDCDCMMCKIRRALEKLEPNNSNPDKKEYKKPEAFDVPKEVQAMADFFGDMFPGSKVEIHRIEPRRKPRDKRRAKNKQKGGKQ